MNNDDIQTLTALVRVTPMPDSARTQILRRLQAVGAGQAGEVFAEQLRRFAWTMLAAQWVRNTFKMAELPARGGGPGFLKEVGVRELADKLKREYAEVANTLAYYVRFLQPNTYAAMGVSLRELSLFRDELEGTSLGDALRQLPDFQCQMCYGSGTVVCPNCKGWPISCLTCGGLRTWTCAACDGSGRHTNWTEEIQGKGWPAIGGPPSTPMSRLAQPAIEPGQVSPEKPSPTQQASNPVEAAETAPGPMPASGAIKAAPTAAAQTDNSGAMNGSENSAPQPQVLLAEDLWKSYGPRPALRGLSFSLQAGRVLGFLGPNGAGKTTAIRILTTILEPDSGRFVVDGVSSEYPERIRRKIGVLPESLGFPRSITGIEYLIYFGLLYGRTKAEARRTGQRLLEEVGLQDRAKSLIGAYSHGMRQRLGIARALVNDPVVVFLDEPTLGLDPRGQQELLALIRRIVQGRYVGVILCSHALSEVEVVCDDVVILSSGQVVATGSVAEVLRQAQRNGLWVQVPSPSVAHARQVLEALPNGMRVVSADEVAGWLQVEPADGTSAEEYGVRNRILDVLLRAEIPVLSLEADGGRLQDVFLSVTEEGIK